MSDHQVCASELIAEPSRAEDYKPITAEERYAAIRALIALDEAREELEFIF